MSNTVWILNLPEEAKPLIEEGQKISSNEVIAKKKNLKIKAPVNALVKKINDRKVHLEFKSQKVSGQGLNKLNNWGKITWKPDIDYSQLNLDYQGQIIILKKENFTPYFVSKARTLGVKGLIVFGGNLASNDWPIPVLMVEKTDVKLIKEKNGVKCLLDASKHCLLIPEND